MLVTIQVDDHHSIKLGAHPMQVAKLVAEHVGCNLDVEPGATGCFAATVTGKQGEFHCMGNSYTEMSQAIIREIVRRYGK